MLMGTRETTNIRNVSIQKMDAGENGTSVVFENINQIVYGALNPGKLRVQDDVFAFKSTKTGSLEKVNFVDIKNVQWSDTANGFGLELLLNNGKVFRFCGLQRSDLQKVEKLMEKSNLNKLKILERDVSGRNVGNIEFDGGILKFMIDGKSSLEIPPQDICASTAGKNEVSVSFHQSDSAQISLMEMRFYIPTVTDENRVDQAESINAKILAHADVIQAIGDALISLPEISCLTPRGRYSVKIYPTFIQLHGKSYDFKITCSSILRLFVLPHPDPAFVLIVISMDPPVRQGQTRYPFVVAQVDTAEEIEVPLSFPTSTPNNNQNSANDLTPEKFGVLYNAESGQMKGPLYEVISAMLKAVVGRKITIPGTFQGAADQKYINCHHRANSGLLYPLERSFLFVHKPSVHVRFEEIVCANFSRGVSSSRSFDFDLSLNNGTNVSFSAIDKDSYGPLYDFITSKGIKISSASIAINSSKLKGDTLYDDFEDDDDDQRPSKRRRTGGDDEDDSFVEDGDDEEDADFDPNQVTAEKNDDKDEFDSNPSTTESEDDVSGSGSGKDDEDD